VIKMFSNEISSRAGLAAMREVVNEGGKGVVGVIGYTGDCTIQPQPQSKAV
jgi:hypothetical protein